MVAECPKCSKTIPVDSVYCPYCGHGIKPPARSTQVSVGGALMIAATMANFIFLVYALQALINIHSWYPALVAQFWFSYNQIFTVFFLTGVLFGLSAIILSLTRKRYRWTMASSLLCTLSGGGAWIISMIIPHSNMLQSLLYYFFPLLAAPSIGVVLIFFRKAEFK
jgi:hypothetical protein